MKKVGEERQTVMLDLKIQLRILKMSAGVLTEFSRQPVHSRSKVSEFEEGSRLHRCS
jgi:hypothetical protein